MRLYLSISILVMTTSCKSKTEKPKSPPAQTTIVNSDKATPVVPPTSPSTTESKAPPGIARDLTGATAFFLANEGLVAMNDKGAFSTLVNNKFDSCFIDETSMSLYLVGENFEVYDLLDGSLTTVLAKIPKDDGFNPPAIRFGSAQASSRGMVPMGGITPVVSISPKSTLTFPYKDDYAKSLEEKSDLSETITEEKKEALKLTKGIALEGSGKLATLAKRRSESTPIKVNSIPDAQKALSFLGMECSRKGDTFCEFVYAGHDHWLVHTSECGEGCYEFFTLYDASSNEFIDLRNGRRSGSEIKNWDNEDDIAHLYKGRNFTMDEGNFFSESLTLGDTVWGVHDQSSILLSNGIWYSTATKKRIATPSPRTCGMISGPLPKWKPDTKTLSYPEPPPCPRKARLEEWISELWEVADDETTDDLQCMAGNFPEPGWLVTGWVVPQDDDVIGMEAFKHHIQLVSPTFGAPLAGHKYKKDHEPGYGGATLTIKSLVDLDGDGIDEIIAEYGYIGGGEDGSFGEIYRRQRSALVKIDDNFSTSRSWEDYETGEEQECENKITIKGSPTDSKTIVVTGNCNEEAGVYHLKGNKLIKKKEAPTSNRARVK